MRYTTVLDAFLTTDRRRRGHLPFDRVLEIYSLYFHSAAAQLKNEELAPFVEQFMVPSPTDGSPVVDYMALAEALRKRDLTIVREEPKRIDLEVEVQPYTPQQSVHFESAMDVTTPVKRHGRANSNQSVISPASSPPSKTCSRPSRFPGGGGDQSSAREGDSDSSPQPPSSSCHSAHPSAARSGLHWEAREGEASSVDMSSLLAAFQATDNDG